MMARKPNLPLPTHDGKLFDWTGNVGMAEASDLGRNFTGRVWNDACDTGFIVRGKREDVVFVYQGALSHSSDISDVYGFRYKSLDGRFQVDIIND